MNITVPCISPNLEPCDKYTVMSITFGGSPFFVGPDDAQQKIEPHHTAVLGEGDSVQVENKVNIKTI